MAESYHVYECPNMTLRRRFETGSRASRFDRELGLLAYQPKRRCAAALARSQIGASLSQRT
eukprot:746755-Prorocentrum_minimum.AAC.1